MKEFHGPSEKTYVQGWGFVPAEFQRLCIKCKCDSFSHKKKDSVLYTGSLTELHCWSRHDNCLYCTNTQRPNSYMDPVVLSTCHAGWEIKSSPDTLQTAWDKQECCWGVLVQRASQWECQGLKAHLITRYFQFVSLGFLCLSSCVDLNVHISPTLPHVPCWVPLRTVRERQATTSSAFLHLARATTVCHTQLPPSPQPFADCFDPFQLTCTKSFLRP